MSTKPHIRNRYMLLGDCIFILASVFASYALRLELGPALLRPLLRPEEKSGM